MQITITGRKLTVGEDLKEHVQKRVDRFNKYSRDLIEAHVVLEVEKYRKNAEVSVFGKSLKITEKSTGETMFAAVDDVCSRVERALRRYKDKVKAHRKKDTDKYNLEENDVEGGLE